MKNNIIFIIIVSTTFILYIIYKFIFIPHVQYKNEIERDQNRFNNIENKVIGAPAESDLIKINRIIELNENKRVEVYEFLHNEANVSVMVKEDSGEFSFLKYVLKKNINTGDWTLLHQIRRSKIEFK